MKRNEIIKRLREAALDTAFPFFNEAADFLKERGMREQSMREALEHCLEVSSDPAKWGRYLSGDDRDIIREALKPTAASESVQEVGALDQAPGSAGKLKNEISLILLSVCRESEPRYRLDGYIRWGLVEREIHEAIDAAIRPTNQAEP